MSKVPPLRLHWFAALALVAIAFVACKDEPDPPVSEPGTFELAFDVRWGNTPLQRSQPYPAPDGRNYQVDVLKFYVSRLSLLTPSDSAVAVKDVALFDLYYPATQVVSGNVPAGSYTGLRFNLGLDYEQNHSNQASYPTDHPMSTTKGMFWTWFTQYIFTMAEGRADTTGGHNEDIWLYHCGQDSLLRPLEFTGLNVVVGEGETRRHTITLDMQKAFWGTQDTIDIVADPNTHTTDLPGLASRWTNQLVRAMQ